MFRVLKGISYPGPDGATVRVEPPTETVVVDLEPGVIAADPGSVPRRIVRGPEVLVDLPPGVAEALLAAGAVERVDEPPTEGPPAARGRARTKVNAAPDLDLGAEQKE